MYFLIYSIQSYKSSVIIIFAFMTSKDSHNEALSHQSFQQQVAERKMKIESVKKDRLRFEELQIKLAESEEQIIRLNGIIDKLNQREKKSTIFFQSKIKELQNSNKQYLMKLQIFELEKQKSKRGQSLLCSKMNKSISYLAQKHGSYMPFHNNQNINMANIQQETLECNNKNCQLRRLEMQKIKKKCGDLTNSLENILYSIKIRQITQWNVEDYEEWSKKLENQRNALKEDSNKNSLVLLKKLQDKINYLHYLFENQGERKNKQILAEPLMQAIKQLKIKQNNLIQVPFLQKIDIQQRKQEYQNFVNEAKIQTNKIISMFKK